MNTSTSSPTAGLNRRAFAALVLAPMAGNGWAQAKPIRAGMSCGTTGPIAETVKSYLVGIHMAIAQANRGGGIAGRSIHLETVDDEYKGELAAANTQAFLQRGVDVLLGYPGTGTVARSLDVLKGKDCLLFGAFTGATHLRAAAQGRAIFITADYRAEVTRLVDHFTTVGASRFVIAYQADGFGTPLLEFAKEALAQRKLPVPQEFGIKPGATLAQEEIATIATSAPHAVLMFTVAGPTIKAVKDLRRNYRGSVGLLSFLSNRAFIDALGADAAGVVLSQVVPGPYDLNHPLIRELRQQQAREELVDVTHASVVGYLTARLFVETLKESQGRVQPAALQAAWEAVKARKPFGFQFNGSGVSYTDIAMLRADGKFVR